MTGKKLDGIDWGGIIIEPAGTVDPDAAHETLEEAAEAKRRADETRAFVLENFRRLQGCELPVEITSIQNLPGHNCLIVNDLLLFSYVEAEQMIRSIYDRPEH